MEIHTDTPRHSKELSNRSRSGRCREGSLFVCVSLVDLRICAFVGAPAVEQGAGKPWGTQACEHAATCALRKNSRGGAPRLTPRLKLAGEVNRGGMFYQVT